MLPLLNDDPLSFSDAIGNLIGQHGLTVAAVLVVLCVSVWATVKLVRHFTLKREFDETIAAAPKDDGGRSTIARAIAFFVLMLSLLFFVGCASETKLDGAGATALRKFVERSGEIVRGYQDRANAAQSERDRDGLLWGSALDLAREQEKRTQEAGK